MPNSRSGQGSPQLNSVETMNKTISLTLAVTLALGGVSTAQSETVLLSINTASAQGDVRAAVYANADAFDQGEVVSGVTVPAKAGSTKMTISGLEAGTYGIALFHDLNGNGELDRNLFGAPSEPYGFSSNPIIKFSAPKFDAFTFEFNGNPMTLNITLNGG